MKPNWSLTVPPNLFSKCAFETFSEHIVSSLQIQMKLMLLSCLNFYFKEHFEEKHLFYQDTNVLKEHIFTRQGHSQRGDRGARTSPFPEIN